MGRVRSLLRVERTGLYINMNRNLILQCFFALLAITAGVKGNNEEEATQEVIDILEDPENYNNDIMPTNESGPVHVEVQMYLRNIEVDDEDMTTEVEATFRMIWNDDRIFYTQDDVEYVTLLDTNKIWLPDPFFKNAIETKQLEAVHPEAYVRIKNNGDITYSTRLRLKLRCEMDLSRFPHDEQVCPILIASYGYNEDRMVFELDEDVTAADPLMYTSRFDYEGFETLSCDSVTKTGKYSCIQINLSLNRVFSSYTLEFYIPCIFLVIVAFFSEIIPAGALLPRLLLTLIPMITLASFTFAYSLSLPAVAYAKASDIFDGISLLVIFALLIHTVFAYYRSLLENAEKRRIDLEGGENFKPSPFVRMMAIIDPFFLFFIVLFYVVFFIIYFAYYAS